MVILNMGSGTITASNQQYDYLFRSRDHPFANMSLYEFISKVRKVKQDEPHIDVNNEYDPEPEFSGTGQFSAPDHPQYKMHQLKCREKVVIPVVLSDKIPRPDRGKFELQNWARTMCILFKPWRHPCDLKSQSETWLELFCAYEPEISEKC